VVRPPAQLVLVEGAAGEKPPAGHSELRRVFEVGPEAGFRDVIRFAVPRPGVVAAEVSWRSGGRLALVLNAPGQGAELARVVGVSPLAFKLEATAEMLRASEGREWVLSIVDSDRRGRAVGRVRVVVPARALRLVDLSASERARLGVLIQPGAPPPGAGVEKTILPNGEVEARYPDGRVVVYHACGHTTVYPDGRVEKMVCNQAQPASLPPAPTDPSLKAFLESHCDHLLQHISHLVDFEQQQVDLYLEFEGSQGPSLYERIRMRTQLIDKLLLE
jgi:hypothetical protein